MYHPPSTNYENGELAIKPQFKSQLAVEDIATVKMHSARNTNETSKYCAPFKQRFEDWVDSWIHHGPLLQLGSNST